MLEILIVLLVLFWAVGYFGPYDRFRAGGLIHIILVVALIVLVFRLLGHGAHWGRW